MSFIRSLEFWLLSSISLIGLAIGLLGVGLGVAGCSLSPPTAVSAPAPTSAPAELEGIITAVQQLVTEVKAGGALVNPAEVAALTTVVADAQAGLTSLSNGQTTTANVYATLATDLAVAAQYIPAIATLVAFAQAQPAVPASMPHAAPDPALIALATHFTNLKKLAGD
jgi:hypothetical protein